VSLTRAEDDQSDDMLDYLCAPFHLKDIRLTPAEAKAAGIDFNREDLHEDVRSLPSDVDDDEEDGKRKAKDQKQVGPKQKSRPK